MIYSTRTAADKINPSNLEILIQERRPSVVSIKTPDETDSEANDEPVAEESKPADIPPPLEKKTSRFSVTKTPDDALKPASPTAANGQTIPTISVTLAESEEQVNGTFMT